MAKPKITKIKASDNKPAPKKVEKVEKKEQKKVKTEKPVEKSVANIEKSTKNIEKSVKNIEKSVKNIEKSGEKKPFFLFRPFIALGRYFRNSWRELRQVRWPSGKATWKLVLAVIIYSAIIMGFITLLDILFSYLSNLILA